MNLPNTFTTWAPLNGKATRIVVDIDAKGELKSWGPHQDTADGSAHADGYVERAWALKSLAWLKAHKCATCDYIALAAKCLASVREPVESMAMFGVQKGRTSLMDAAAAMWKGIPEDMAALESAHMSDLCDRMAAEMERQATEAAKTGCACPAVPYTHERSEGCTHV